MDGEGGYHNTGMRLSPLRTYSLACDSAWLGS